VKLERIKENLAMITISDLEERGMSLSDFEDDEIVQLFTTTDEYSEENNEITWVAAIKSDDCNLVTITNGTIYDEETAKELDEEVEISRITIDENKAEMFLEAISHAYPHLMEDIKIENKKPTKSSSSRSIKDLRKEIKQLEKLKSQTPVCSDTAIEIYDKIKDYASSYKDSTSIPTTVRRKKSLIFVSGFKDSKVVKLVEANINEAAQQGLEDLSAKAISKTVLIDKKLARSLIKEIKHTFK
jgi:tRNA-dihydrouridine synthase